jgi:anti-sigma factor RsiW
MYLDGELTPHDAEPYLTHLHGCTPCQAFVDGEQRFRQVFRAKAAGREQVPLALRSKIESLSRAKRARPLQMLAASAALATLALFTWTTQSAFTPVLASVAEKHRQALPLDVSTHDAQQAQTFVQAHVPTLKLPHFKAREVQLTGARVVDCPGHHGAMVRYVVGPNAQPFSIAVYRADANEHIAMSEMVSAGEHRVFVDRVGELQAAVWQGQGMVYSMVGNMDRDTMLKMVSDAD